MIRLTDIELVDFGRHRRIKQPLDGNVVGLSGPNGKGKSTILQAIQFGITGTIDHKDPLSEWIRKGTRGGSAPAKSASVTLGFVTDSGKKGTITRKITKSSTSRELFIEGMEAPVSADKKVADIMFQLLGVDKKALNSTVFIKQGAIDKMFGDEPERRDFYTRLLMLGHLPKIAGVIDGVRKSVGSSVVDLSGVLDEARNAENVASDNFTRADQALALATDCSVFIQPISRLGVLFADQAAACEAINSALAKLGADPEAHRKELADAVGQINAEIDAITRKRLESSQSREAHTSTIRALEGLQALLKLHNELLDVVDAVAKLRNTTDGPDPRPIVTELQRKLDASDVLALNGPKERILIAEEVALAAELEQATLKAVGLNNTYESLLQTVTEQRQNYDIRLKIYQELQAAAAADHVHTTKCLVCGGSSVDGDYLAKSITAIKSSLDMSALMLEHTGKDRDAAVADGQAAARAHNAKLAELSAVRAQIESAVTILNGDSNDRDTLSLLLAKAQADADAYTTALAESTRLSARITQLNIEINHRPIPSAEEAQAAQLAVETTKARIIEVDPAWDQKESDLRGRAVDLANELKGIDLAATNLDSARQWASRVDAELQAICAGVVQTLPASVYEKGTVVTAATADAMLTRLQALQAEFDHLRGMREAARNAMVLAQNRVIDTETKIESQKARLALVERLSRLRDAFMPSGVSMDYLDFKFSQVATLASDYLAESGADFTVMASTTSPLAFDFIRMEPGEEWLTQSRLSGGQRVRLAVATLRAIHSMVVPDVGLLVLDEPTTHLDTEAKLAMADMLRRIGEEGGLQMLVCDHDPVLVDAFTTTIDIPE